MLFWMCYKKNKMNHTSKQQFFSTPSPWLHQPTPVTSADGIGLLSHIPVRPSSAEPHRPLKIAAHSSPPLTKCLVDHHKE